MAFFRIGHRGAAGLEPENTLVSIQRAIDLGVDAVEFDVHMSKDGAVVVIHDDTVERTTNGSGAVSEMTLAELKALDAGKGERIPTLLEVIGLAKGRVKMVIELKGADTEEPVVRIVEEKDIASEVIVISFNHDRVKRVKELNPKIRTGILIVGAPVYPSHLVKDASADNIHPNLNFVDREFVEEAHRSGIHVSVWNADTVEDIKKMKGLGVDSIGSNYPNLLG
ncbi:MAG: glycerophosphodiester phosphodiesterase family protein [archaeon]